MITEIRQFSECHLEWGAAIRKVQTRQELLGVCAHFSHLVHDAFVVVEKMTDSEFNLDWLPGFKLECLGNMSAGTEWNKKYACVMFPEIISKVGLMAMEANIPFGMAYNIFQTRSNFKCPIPYIDKE